MSQFIIERFRYTEPVRDIAGKLNELGYGKDQLHILARQDYEGLRLEEVTDATVHSRRFGLVDDFLCYFFSSGEKKDAIEYLRSIGIPDPEKLPEIENLSYEDVLLVIKPRAEDDADSIKFKIKEWRLAAPARDIENGAIDNPGVDEQIFDK